MKKHSETILSFAVANVIKAAVVVVGTFLWIESRIPSTKRSMPKLSDQIKARLIQVGAK